MDLNDSHTGTDGEYDDYDDFSNFFDSSGELDYNKLATEYGQEDVENNVPLMYFRIFLCGFGLLGNIVVIFVILVLREHKKAITHWYVLQLAFADSLFLLTLPFNITEEVHGEWIFTTGMCKAKETVLFLNYNASILFLTVMSIDRYIAVCHGFSERLQKLRTKQSSYIVTLIIWVTSLLLCIPIMIFSERRGEEPHCVCLYEFPKSLHLLEQNCLDELFNSNDTLNDCVQRKLNNGDQTCTKPDLSMLDGFSGNGGNFPFSGADFGETDYTDAPESGDSSSPQEDYYMVECSYRTNGSGWTSFLIFNFIILFVLPFVIMSVCFCFIALQLKSTGMRGSTSDVNESTTGASTSTVVKKKTKRKKSAASAKAEKDRNRVTFTCLVLVLLFLACWLPFHSVHLAKIRGIAGKPGEFCTHLGAIASMLAYLNSALNPYIYNLLGTRFGKRLRKAAGSVKTSFSTRTTTVRYHRRNKHSGGSSSNSATMMTRIHKGKSELDSSQVPSNADDKNAAEVKTSLV